MTKSELRSLYKLKRKVLSSEKAHAISLGILSNLKTMDIWKYSTFHIFIPILNQNEINTLPILEHLFELNKKVIVPKISGDQMLNCLIDEHTEFETGKFNVPEPETFQLVDAKLIEVVFLPMMICDRKGNRIGYGGGFYDLFLNRCKKDVVKIGLNFFEPIDRIDDVFESDVPLNYCVTGEGIVSF